MSAARRASLSPAWRTSRFLGVLGMIGLHLVGVARASEVGDDHRPPREPVPVEAEDRCLDSRLWVRSDGGARAATAEDRQALDGDPETGARLAGDGSETLELRFIGAPRWLNRIVTRTDAENVDVEIRNLDDNWVPWGDAGASITSPQPAGECVVRTGSAVLVRGIRLTPGATVAVDEGRRAGTGDGVYVYEVNAYFDWNDPDDGDALAGSSDEYHYDWANDYPGTADDLSKCDNDAQGLADQLPSSWATPGHGDANAHEVHFKRTDMGGSNSDHVDDGDLSYWAGHGDAGLWDSYYSRSLGGVILGNQTEDDANAMPGDAHDAWGDGDMEWIILAACEVLDSVSRPYWHDTMVGAHLICGAETNIDDAVYGKVIGKKLVDNGVFDTAKTVKSAWFDAMEKKNGSGRTAIVIGETSSMGDDYLWGQGPVGSDPTHDCCYTKWSLATSGLLAAQRDGMEGGADEPPSAVLGASTRLVSNNGSPGAGTGGDTGVAAGSSGRLRFERRTPRGFTVEIDPDLLLQPAVESMPVYNVVPRDIDSTDVRMAAQYLCETRGILCGGDIGPGDPGDLNLIDGVHELRLGLSSGAIHYEDVARWLGWRNLPPDLPSENEAVGMANQLLMNWGRLRPGMVLGSVDYLRQAHVSFDGQNEVEDPDSSFATAIRVNYGRMLGSSPSYPVAGPGGTASVAFGNGGRLLRLFEGAWRQVEVGNEVPIMTLAEAIEQMTTYGWDAAVTAIRTPIDVVRIDVWEHAYYERDSEEVQNQIRPVYRFEVTLLSSTSAGASGSPAEICVWADRAQPRSEILSPPDRSYFPAGTEVCFTGTATGGVPPLDLVWRDDLGNLLGTGANVCTFLEAPPDTGDGSGDRVRTVTLTVRDALGREGTDRVRILFDDPAGAPETTSAGAFVLEGSRPNPFARHTEIRFQTPSAVPATLRVHDAAGRLVRTLVEKDSSGGPRIVTWDGRDDSGTEVGAGVYFYELTAGAERTRRKVVILR